MNREEAIKIVKSHYPANKQMLNEALETLIPELKEDEDVLTWLKNYISEEAYSLSMDIRDNEDRIKLKKLQKSLAWLEKQESYYTFEIKEGHWYKCICDYMLNNSDLMFKNGSLYYCRSNWRLSGEIDERNVKDIGVNGYKSFFRPATNREIEDWLEKQGGSKSFWKPSEEQYEALTYAYNSCSDTERGNYYEGVLESLIEDLHRLDEHHPKFHVGDWIVVRGEAILICDIRNDLYDVMFASGEHRVYDTNILDEDKEAHLWTIADAQVGDVLTWDDSKCIALFKNIYDKESFNSYGFVGHCTNTFESRISYHDIKGAHPATKKQRDLLFAKMEEAGYEWDIENKKLTTL